MRPDCLIRDILTDKLIGSVDHVQDQLLSLRLAQLADALQSFGIIFNLLFGSLAHFHAQLIGIQGRGFGPPTFELDMLLLVLASPPEPVSGGP